MAEVLLQFDPPLTDGDGQTWHVRVCGRVADDSLWEGWIEFAPQDGVGSTLRTPAETKQPNRADLEYWATGLTIPYLEGALDRARYPETPDLRPRSVPVQAAYERPAAFGRERPAASGRERADASGAAQVRPNAVLDPFEVYVQGEDVLRQELGALDEGHLRNLVLAYSLGGADARAVDGLTRGELEEMIVGGVRGRVGTR